MKKSIYLAFFLVSLCANNASGQESAKNTLYGGISLTSYVTYIATGFTIEYEHSLNNMFSVSIDMGIDLLPYAEIKGRWYPWSKTFFTGLGIGIWGFFPYPEDYLSLLISPAIGWKINIGKQNRWVLVPNITYLCLPFGSVYRDDDWWKESFKISFSIGYKF